MALATTDAMDWSANIEAQADEVLALEAIFEGIFTFTRIEPDTSDPGQDPSAAIVHRGTIHVDAILPDGCRTMTVTATAPKLAPPVGDDFVLRAKQRKRGPARKQASPVATAPASLPSTTVEALPPVLLHFALPATYPSHVLPDLSLSCAWLADSTLADLTAHVISTLDAPADANVQLYMAYEAVRDALAAHLASLDVLAVSPAVYQMLVDHDRDTKQAEFDQHEFTCLICLTTHRGRAGVAMAGCAHVFCRSCLVPFYTMLVREGMPMNVRCPHPQCAVVPAARDAAPATADDAAAVHDPEAALAAHPITESWLATLIGDQLASQWRVQFIEKVYAADPAMQWCARLGCTGAARRGDGRYAKLATCLQCRFAFCVYCLRAWHGNVSGCELPSSHVVVEAWVAAENLPEHERDRAHAELAMRYGRATVAVIVQRYRDEQATLAYLQENAKSCPYCGQATIKSAGCNHMTCGACRGHFCYLCGDGLNHLPNFYAHWSEGGGTKCGMKLFDTLVDDAGDEVVYYDDDDDWQIQPFD
ncbi:translation termination inhibitor protein itt1 [Allomyces javanicus]|nr:translation termination inhibitor protein itt1 [Allomyces javanicus]